MVSTPVVETRLPEPNKPLVVSKSKDVQIDDSSLKTHLNALNRALYRLSFDPTRNGRTVLFKETTGDTGIVIGDEVIIFNIASPAIATLPDPTTNQGHGYSIVNKYTSTSKVTFSRNINGDASFFLVSEESVTILSDGVEYLVYE